MALEVVLDVTDKAIEHVILFPTQLTSRSKRRSTRLCGLLLQPLVSVLLAIPVLLPLLALNTTVSLIRESKYVS